MALENIAAELVGWLPKLAKTEAYKLVNDAWTDVRNDRLWSFQLGEDGITTPNVITTGTVTVPAIGSTTATANAAASAALTGLSNPLLTQRQFRVQGYSIYSIIKADFTVPAAVVLTLDRPFVDPIPFATPVAYLIYQAYFPTPVADFKRYIDWRDMVNGEWLDVHATRREVNMGDPQRLYYTFPHWVLGNGLDIRGQGTANPSATIGFPWHELYPNPLQKISYMRWWLRTGVDLIQPEDVLPYPVTEKLISSRARMFGYQFAEANRDPSTPRGQTADFKFLYQAAEKEYTKELKLIGQKDRDIVDLYKSRMIRDQSIRKLPYYSTLTGRAFSGD